MEPPIVRAVRHLEQGDWEKAHVIVQDDESELGCWVHGIVHLEEGDLDNARYWYGRANRRFSNDTNARVEIRALRAALEP